MSSKKIGLLGSTGSIGVQAIEIVKEHSELFEINLLTANNNAELLIQQALEIQPQCVVITNEDKFTVVQDSLKGRDINVMAGDKALEDAISSLDMDVLVTAIVGYAGLKPTLKAIDKGIDIALANKETLVVAGDLVTSIAKSNGVNIFPIDSEHSAIFQCLVGEKIEDVEKIYLTASGGPFRGKSREELAQITKEQALKHPNWDMGAKITIDSATLMNKGLEAIEAKWLFDLSLDQIDVVVHPQSIIHSIVQFNDSSMKAQMGLPDMRLPILYALGFPDRISSDLPRLDFAKHHNLTFEEVDKNAFRNLDLAFEALKKCGNLPCIVNAANEIAVDAFLKDKVGFLEMSDVIEGCMSKVTYIAKPVYDDYVETDTMTRKVAQELL